MSYAEMMARLVTSCGNVSKLQSGEVTQKLHPREGR